MLQYIVNNNGLIEQMRINKLNPDEDLPFIKELIKGVQASESQHEERSTNKPFLYEIVVNQLNGVDVRKWDYIARDCHMLGIPKNFDYERLLEFVRVCDVNRGEENREQHICFRDKVADNVYDMFHTRYTLHRKAYKHKICYIIEEKIAEALRAAQRFPDLLVNVENLDIEHYTKLTDHIFNKILHSPEPDLNEARGILEDIVHRRLPKFVGEARLKEPAQWTQNHVKDSWRDMCRNNNLNAQHFQIYDLKMGFGKGGNPLDNVYFYNKRDLNTAFSIQSYQVSSLKPVKICERLVRVYCTDMDQRVQRKAEQHFHKWCTNNKGTFIDFGPVLDDDDSGEGAY
ncbi:deoxynucleoside triphosphate triphosphohydrolase SAMHD1-like [Cyprinus carpio]|uniref:Deoxynucleoside triphosphate triphosphohydrolase SAMHD1-like n=1 Tax=Cyprinus carpio TaxID=7962 RepID=A0A9Q9ZTC5_CYPCA|nr:deoxynucleoside triphosphate triphosphohydrolase SAMHD1-like [Cyprinus carpio]